MKKVAFHARTRMLRVSSNFGLKKNCPVRKDTNSQDCQAHLPTYENLALVNIVVKKTPEYDDLFGYDLENVLNVVGNVTK